MLGVDWTVELAVNSGVLEHLYTGYLRILEQVGRQSCMRDYVVRN